jgi:beta-galactosidase GanA
MYTSFPAFHKNKTMPHKCHSAAWLAILMLIFLNIDVCKAQSNQTDAGMPHLQKNGKATQLMVDGKPFLIVGGELNNSSSSSIAYMKPIWQLMTDLHFNTALTPLSWDLVEQQEGKFDFSLVDSLIIGARQNNMHIVFLWLASWKNGMSSYMPLWVKENYKKYTRIKIKDNRTMEVLTPLSAASAQADAKAFAAVMKHIKEFDGTIHTVLMMQVENEVGILDDSRDRSAVANAAFAEAVPKELTDYLSKNKNELVPEIKDRWEKNGSKTTGNWEEIFGKADATDEIFMAWNYARYVNKVITAGKKEYPIPMYTNAWLNQGENPKPGNYPSGGPLDHVFDIWLAGAPAIDILSPDVYVAEYDERCRRFTQRNNPLFIPEMNSGEDGARNIFIAIGKYNAIGVSPFGIDRLAKDAALGKSYDIINQLGPFITDKQAKGEIIGFVVDEKNPSFTYNMGGYALEISLDEIFGHRSKLGYGVVMTDDGPNKFMGAGSGFRVRFYPTVKDNKTIIGIANVDEGIFSNNRWIPGRRLNGDENDQGRAWRFAFWKLGIEKCMVYKYE